MRIFKWLYARMGGLKPMSDERAFELFMEATKTMKPTPIMAHDFARLIEREHGIVWSKNDRP